MLFFCPWLIVDIGLVRSRSSTSASSWPSLTWKAIPLPPDPRGKNSLSLSACPTPTNPNQRSTAKPVPLNWPALLSWQSSPDSSHKTRSFSNPPRHFSSPADKAQIVFRVLQFDGTRRPPLWPLAQEAACHAINDDLPVSAKFTYNQETPCGVY